MNKKYVLAALCGLTALACTGGAAQASPTMRLYPQYFIVEQSTVQPAPVSSQQDIVGYTDTKHPRPVYRWEKELQQDTAARSLIEEQLTGRPPDVNFDGFYENYYQVY